MTAALGFARRGFAVTLVEREPALGGILRHLDKLYPTRADARDLVEQYTAEVSDHPHIDVLTSAQIHEVRGYIGNYELLVRSEQYGMDMVKNTLHDGILHWDGTLIQVVMVLFPQCLKNILLST